MMGFSGSSFEPRGFLGFISSFQLSRSIYFLIVLKWCPVLRDISRKLKHSYWSSHVIYCIRSIANILSDHSPYRLYNFKDIRFLGCWQLELFLFPTATLFHYTLLHC